MNNRTRELIESALEAVSRLQGRCPYPDGTNYRLDLDCIDDALRRALAEGWPKRPSRVVFCPECGEPDGVHSIHCAELFANVRPPRLA